MMIGSSLVWWLTLMELDRGVWYENMISFSLLEDDVQVCNKWRGNSRGNWLLRFTWLVCTFEGDRLSGKPGNVREFDSCQGNVRDFTENQGIVREKIMSGKSCLKLFIVNCIFVSIQVFSTSTGMIWVTLNMPCAAEECREPSGNCHGISHCLQSSHPDL